MMLALGDLHRLALVDTSLGFGILRDSQLSVLVLRNVAKNYFASINLA